MTQDIALQLCAAFFQFWLLLLLPVVFAYSLIRKILL